MSADEPDDRASDGLAVAIEEVLEAEELDVPVTLGALRTVLARATESRAAALRRPGPGQRHALLHELDELIHAHGRSAAADRFTPVCPREGVDSLLELALASGSEATLEDVRSMIVRHGRRAFAEDLIGRT